MEDVQIYNELKDKVVHISEASDRKGVYTKPTPIGWKEIDNVLKGGVREGDLVIVTGLSGEGKTTVAQNITLNLSKNMGACLWFSYEVLIDNLLAKFQDMGMKVDDLPIFTPKRNTTGNLDWIKKKIEEAVKEYDTKFIFIDHIDFISPTTITKSDQRRIILKDICTEIKNIAIELKVVVFLIAHVKKVQGREVEMQDIAESSGIYQLADFILAVQRNKIKENINGYITEVEQDTSTLRLLKNRLTGEKQRLSFKVLDNVMKVEEKIDIEIK